MTDLVDAVATAIHLPLRAMKRMGVAPAASLSDGEIRGNAQLLSLATLGALWHLRRRSPPWAEVSRAWEQHAGSHGVDPWRAGRFDPADRVTLVTDNAEAFALRTRLHAAAARTLDVATYYLQGDDTGRAVVSELVAAAKRGVRVRLVADGAIVRKKQLEGLGALDRIEDLRAGGVEVRLWHDAARPYDANHRKLLLVDGAHLVMGGRNLADHYAGSAWRDVELHVHGPSARTAAALFERTFEGRPEPAFDPAAPAALVHATTPADIASHGTFVYLLQCLGAARRTVDIENAYLFAHDALVRAIASATARGVRVRLLTNSAESNDLDYANHRLYTGFGPLLDAGAELHLRRGRGRTLHCKYFVADGEWVSLGSTNLDYYSPRHCTESNVQARSDELGAALTAWFEAGLADAERATDRAALARFAASQTLGRAIDALLRDSQ